MTKKEFMAGKPFKAMSSINIFEFVNEPLTRAVGHLTMFNGTSKSYYANVEKVSSVSASIYFTGINKIQKEVIKFSDLELLIQSKNNHEKIRLRSCNQ